MVETTIDANDTEFTPTEVDWAEQWRAALTQMFCNVCDAHYLRPEAVNASRCPNCYRGQLMAADDTVAAPDAAQSPELVLPFAINPERALDTMLRFGEPITLPPKDLNPDRLKRRMQKAYLPVWLVDIDVEASWRADAGFDETVTVKEEQQIDGKWVSTDVEKTRTRWKPRTGSLKRRYDNIHTAALHAYHQLEQRIGNYDEQAAAAYTPDAIDDALVMLPDRSNSEAWQDAPFAARKLAMDDAVKALKADKIRGYQWTPSFTNHNWTLLLVPLYSSYYLDDDGRPQVIFVNGHTGGVDGSLRGSVARGRTQLIFGIINALMLSALGVYASIQWVETRDVLLAALAAAGYTLAISALILQSIPLSRVVQFNQMYAITSVDGRHIPAANNSHRFVWAKLYDPAEGVGREVPAAD